MLRSQQKPGVQPFHVFDGINGHSAFADLAKDAFGIAVQPIKRWAVEGRAEANSLLLRRQIMKSAVGVLSQAKSRKEARRLFQCGVWSAECGLLQIHFP